MREEKLFTDLAEVFEPKSLISPIGTKNVWRSVPYRARYVHGNMLSSLGNGRPGDISFDPGLTGWYKIYLALPETTNVELHIKLTRDAAFSELCPMDQGSFVTGTFEETLWRCCDMTDQKIILSKRFMNHVKLRHSMLGWIRCVPMEDAEVEAYLADRACKEHKRLYATDDIHNRLYEAVVEKDSDWDVVVQPYADSDVEWLSLEDVECFCSGKVPTEDPEDFGFIREGDAAVYRQMEHFDSVRVLSHLVGKGHEIGLKMSVSLRMGAWTMGFPFDQIYFENNFYWENQHLCCIGRCGHQITSLSYAFPEVQQYMIDRLVTLASTGCDALTLISHRGGPYLMYEKPVADRFYEMYGEYPYELPLDEPRLSALHCSIMTEFFQKLRNALDAACPDRHVEVHLRALWSIYDTRYYAIDCEELAKKGLVDAIISYPQRLRETHEEAYFENGRFKLEEYAKHLCRQSGRPFIRNYDNTYGWEPYPDSNGVLQGPKDLNECVAQWMELEKQYGVKIYIELMPRVMAPEKLRQFAQDIYAAGAERIALWDTYGRVTYSALWNLVRNLGHKDALPEGPFSQQHRTHELAGCVLIHNHPVWGG